jgi:hypothetical protein
MIAVQNQIAQITGTIERLKGQIKYLDAHTAFSALTITMTEAPATAPAPASDNWGFATALSDAAHNFVATVNYVIVGLGVLGPFILLGVGYLSAPAAVAHDTREGAARSAPSGRGPCPRPLN